MPKFNHAFDLNVEIVSTCENGSDVTGAMLKEKYLALINSLSDEDFRAECNLFDTFKEKEYEARLGD